MKTDGYGLDVQSKYLDENDCSVRLKYQISDSEYFHDRQGVNIQMYTALSR